MPSMGLPVNSESCDLKAPLYDTSAVFIFRSSQVNHGAEWEKVTVLVLTGAWRAKRLFKDLS